MNCMKCGREIPADQVFCDACRAEMEKYPVKPGIAVQLPKREKAPRKPSVKRSVPSPEAQLARLKRRYRLVTVILALSILLAAVGGFFVGTAAQRAATERHRGQNYSTSSTTPSETGDNVSRETSNTKG